MQFQVQAGAPGKKTSGGAKLTEKKDERAPWSFKCKQGLQGRKRQGRQIDGEKDEMGAMQFQVQAGAPREENVRVAKLKEKKTRGVPCSFKCKQRLQGIKRQGRSIDGEKENKSLNCQTYFPFGLKIRNVVFLNSIIMMLGFFFCFFVFFFYVSPVFNYTSAVPSLKFIGEKI